MTDDVLETTDELSKPELQAQAEYLGLPKSGTKTELQERIDAKIAGVAERARSVTPDDYTVGEWSGLTNYECNRCSYASLRKRAIILHVAEMHAEG